MQSIKRHRPNIIKTIKHNDDLNETTYRQFVSSIVINLMLLTGISCKVIKDIKISNYNDADSIIVINGFRVYLPHNLSSQIELYWFVREYIGQINNKIISDQLFIWIDGTDGKPKKSNMPSSNNFYAEFINSALGIYGVKPIHNHSLIKLMGEGVSIDLLKELTGHGDEVIKECRNIAFKDMNYRKALEDKLRTSSLFDKL